MKIYYKFDNKNTKYFISCRFLYKYSAWNSAMVSKRIFFVHMIRFVMVKCMVKNDAST
jgi:hypothetical protein